MSNDTKLTQVEWEILENVWKLGKSVSARQVHETAFPHGEKAFTTVQTILTTLVKKNVLHCEKIGMVNFYTPVKSRKAMLVDQLSLVASQMFHGSVPDMANFLINTEHLGLDEINKLKALLESKEQQLKDESK
ncbi:BlaI/MecI/CopY family transcriptional regulator [candidate division KSB1 bacterium]|nr:BlaI/MecI/CopY family transcriptional regulator [candidate division KSB1 bacterium]